MWRWKTTGKPDSWAGSLHYVKFVNITNGFCHANLLGHVILCWFLSLISSPSIFHFFYSQAREAEWIWHWNPAFYGRLSICIKVLLYLVPGWLDLRLSLGSYLFLSDSFLTFKARKRLFLLRDTSRLSVEIFILNTFQMPHWVPKKCKETKSFSKKHFCWLTCQLGGLQINLCSPSLGSLNNAGKVGVDINSDTHICILLKTF